MTLRMYPHFEHSNVRSSEPATRLEMRAKLVRVPHVGQFGRLTAVYDRAGIWKNASGMAAALSILIRIFAQCLRFYSDGPRKIFEGQCGEARCQNRVGAFLRQPHGLLCFVSKIRCICHTTHRSVRREHEELSVTDNCRERVDEDPNVVPYVRFRTLSHCLGSSQAVRPAVCPRHHPSTVRRRIL
jgi:hypothetical protein